MTLEEWKQARNRALTELDLEWARKECPEASSDEVLLIALHRARYECDSIADALRLESGEWLRARGHRGMYGALLPPGELPR